MHVTRVDLIYLFLIRFWQWLGWWNKRITKKEEIVHCRSFFLFPKCSSNLNYYFQLLSCFFRASQFFLNVSPLMLLLLARKKAKFHLEMELFYNDCNCTNKGPNFKIFVLEAAMEGWWKLSYQGWYFGENNGWREFKGNACSSVFKCWTNKFVTIEAVSTSGVKSLPNAFEMASLEKSAANERKEDKKPNHPPTLPSRQRKKFISFL